MHDKNHRKTCFKNSREFCRFHFPWKLRDNTVIKLLKLKGDKTYGLRVLAKRNDVWVNNYNGWMLIHFRGNMDIQFICNPDGVAIYCCLYSSKAEAPDYQLINNAILKLLGKDDEIVSNDHAKKKFI